MTASDFKAFNKGRFLDYYEIGKMLGEGKVLIIINGFRCIRISI